jgi:hypothetical protein
MGIDREWAVDRGDPQGPTGAKRFTSGLRIPIPHQDRRDERHVAKAIVTAERDEARRALANESDLM